MRDMTTFAFSYFIVCIDAQHRAPQLLVLVDEEEVELHSQRGQPSRWQLLDGADPAGTSHGFCDCLKHNTV
jgi:hypothetical protein